MQFTWKSLVFPLLLIGLFPAAGAFAEKSPLKISGAWVRALPPGQPATAAYLDLHNSGDNAILVTGADSPVAGRAEIHRTREVDGLTGMEPVPQLIIEPGATVHLAPGSMHLMLLELERMPREGESVKICLRYDAGAACTQAPVQRSSAQSQGHSHH